MLAAYLIWHLRRAWAPLTFTDEHPPQPADPVAPARRSTAAATKASRPSRRPDAPVHTFRGLLDHLATLTRNDIRYGTTDTAPVVPTSPSPPPPNDEPSTCSTPIPLTLT